MLMQDEIPGLGRRCTSVLIDFIMLELAMWPLGLAIRELTPSAALLRLLQFVIAIFYSSVFLAERGQTPGKIMASLRTISSDGGALNQRQALVRSTIKWGWIFLPLIAMALLLGPLPTNVQKIGTEAPLVTPELDPMIGVVGVLTIALWFVLIAVTRSHRNRQASHDRVSETVVMRVQ